MSQIDPSEVENLASQLASQVSYSNDLIVQLSELEKRQLDTQRDVQQKQMALRQAMAVCDSVRADQNELKQKLVLAQQVAEKASAQAKRARVEAQVKAQEADALHRFSKEAQMEIEALRSETLELRSKLDNYAKEKDSLRNNLDAFAKHEADRVNKHRENFEQQSKELQTLKSKQKPLEFELEKATQHIKDLERELRDGNMGKESLKEELERARKRIQDLEETTRDINLREARFKSDLHNEQSRAQRTAQQVGVIQELADSRQKEIEKARKENAELKQSNLALQNEIRTLNGEIQELGADLLAQAQARAAEKEKFDVKARELQDDLSKLAEESRLRERQQTEEAANRSAEATEHRKHSEAQYSKLQDEYRQLNDVLQALQSDNATQAQEMENERVEAETKLRDAIERAREAEVKHSMLESDSKREAANLLGEIQRLQNELDERTSGYVQSTGGYQNAIQQLSLECQQLHTAYNDAMEEINNLEADMNNVKGFDESSIQEWHAETKRGMIALSESNNALRAEVETARDGQLAAQVQRDEEHARNLMLEEDYSRLQEDMKHLQKRMGSMDAQNMERLRQAKIDAESVASVRDDMSSRLQKVLAQLEEANAQNRMLQEENQKATSALADAQRRNNQRVAGFDKQLQDTDAKLRDAINEKESLAADRDLMKRLNDDLSNKLRKAQEGLEQLEKSKKSDSDLQKSSLRSTEDTLNAVRESSRKYQAQLSQTKGLLRVVQEARKRLQEDNIALRTELDEVLRRSLNMAANSANADTTKGRSSIPSNQDITIPKTMAHQSSASPVRPTFIGSSGIRAPQQKHRGSVSSSVSTASAENVQMQQLAMDDEDDDEDAARELEKLRKEVEALKSSP
uniref:Uncharacterized protein n=1 Tax=Aplanochytrium stocchinoi TaxID=215587 RepID=A0A7S3PLA1_9STRA